MTPGSPRVFFPAPHHRFSPALAPIVVAEFIIVTFLINFSPALILPRLWPISFGKTCRPQHNDTTLPSKDIDYSCHFERGAAK
jgi:hypothetical protein